MKIFLDTNVVASATATRGLCADVFRKVVSSHELVVSSQLLEELSRVLNDKFGLSNEIISDVIRLLRQDSEFSDPLPSHVIKISDESDIQLLSAAINRSVDIFVTGDKELLELQKIGNMKILSPRKFWEILKAQQ